MYLIINLKAGEYIIKTDGQMGNNPKDWIPLVRCKDCIFGKRQNSPILERNEYNCRLLDIIMPNDGYCWYGERKEE